MITMYVPLLIVVGLPFLLIYKIYRSRFREITMIALFIIAIVFLGAVSFAMINTRWPVSGVSPQTPTTAALAGKLFGEGGFILPLEIAPVLLLAAILGAIVLVREK